MYDAETRSWLDLADAGEPPYGSAQCGPLDVVSVIRDHHDTINDQVGGESQVWVRGVNRALFQYFQLSLRGVISAGKAQWHEKLPGDQFVVNLPLPPACRANPHFEHRQTSTAIDGYEYGPTSVVFSSLDIPLTRPLESRFEICRDAVAESPLRPGPRRLGRP